jgi:hypothetical protein
MTAFTAFTGVSATAEEKPVRLRQAPGLDKVEAQCSACHSLDYVQMNSPFLSAAGWDAEVARMINAFGAPIGEADAKTIVDYLDKNYGSESIHAVTARSAGVESSSLEKEKARRTRVVVIPRISNHASFKRSRRPAPAFAWSAPRRPLVLTTIDEFNLEGVLEHRSVFRLGAYRRKR